MSTTISSLRPAIQSNSGQINQITLTGSTTCGQLIIKVTSPTNPSLILRGIWEGSGPNWTKEFNASDDFFLGDIQCGDVLDIRIECSSNGSSSLEASLPMPVLCVCNSTINEALEGFYNANNQLTRLVVTGTATLCRSGSVIVSVIDSNGHAIQMSVPVSIDGSWEAIFIHNQSSINLQPYECDETYKIQVVCKGDEDCSSSKGLVLQCSVECPDFLDITVTGPGGLSLQNPETEDLECVPPGNYTITVTSPPSSAVTSYQWFKERNELVGETSDTLTFPIANGENVSYLVIANIDDVCQSQATVVFHCSCEYSDWSEWKCVNGVKTRTRTIVTPTKNGGKCQGVLIQTDGPCEECEYSDWSEWKCVNGIKTRTRTIVTPAKNGGKCEGNLIETDGPCEVPPPCDWCCIWFIINIIATIATLIAVIIAGCVMMGTDPISITIATTLAIATIISWILWGFFCLLLNFNKATCQWLLLLIEILDLAEFFFGLIAFLLAGSGDIPCAMSFAIDWGFLGLIRRILNKFSQFSGCQTNPFSSLRN